MSYLFWGFVLLFFILVYPQVFFAFIRARTRSQAKLYVKVVSICTIALVLHILGVSWYVFFMGISLYITVPVMVRNWRRIKLHKQVVTPGGIRRTRLVETATTGTTPPPSPRRRGGRVLFPGTAPAPVLTPKPKEEYPEGEVSDSSASEWTLASDAFSMKRRSRKASLTSSMPPTPPPTPPSRPTTPVQPPPTPPSRPTTPVQMVDASVQAIRLDKIDRRMEGRINVLESRIRLEELRNRSWTARMRETEDSLNELKIQIRKMLRVPRRQVVNEATNTSTAKFRTNETSVQTSRVSMSEASTTVSEDFLTDTVSESEPSALIITEVSSADVTLRRRDTPTFSKISLPQKSSEDVTWSRINTKDRPFVKAGPSERTLKSVSSAEMTRNVYSREPLVKSESSAKIIDKEDLDKMALRKVHPSEMIMTKLDHGELIMTKTDPRGFAMTKVTPRDMTMTKLNADSRQRDLAMTKVDPEDFAMTKVETNARQRHLVMTKVEANARQTDLNMTKVDPVNFAMTKVEANARHRELATTQGGANARLRDLAVTKVDPRDFAVTKVDITSRKRDYITRKVDPRDLAVAKVNPEDYAMMKVDATAQQVNSWKTTQPYNAPMSEEEIFSENFKTLLTRLQTEANEMAWDKIPMEGPDSSYLRSETLLKAGSRETTHQQSKSPHRASKF